MKNKEGNIKDKTRDDATNLATKISFVEEKLQYFHRIIDVGGHIYMGNFDKYVKDIFEEFNSTMKNKAEDNIEQQNISQKYGESITEYKLRLRNLQDSLQVLQKKISKQFESLKKDLKQQEEGSFKNKLAKLNKAYKTSVD